MNSIDKIQYFICKGYYRLIKSYSKALNSNTSFDINQLLEIIKMKTSKHKKMKNIFLFSILFLSLNCLSQSVDTTFKMKDKISPVDTIFKMNGDILPVKITEINESNIKFIYPGEEFTNSIGKNSVLKIKFKSGRIQEFAPALNLVNVKSCLDWENVQISNIETEVSGLMKIDNIGAKAKGNTTMSSLGKLQSRAYNKIKMETAMLGGNVCYIINQNTEEAITGYTSKVPSVTISAISYTLKKVYMREINYGIYNVKDVYVLQVNRYNIDPLYHKTESFNITSNMIYLENNFPKLKLNSRNIEKVNEFTIIYASQNELILSGVYTSRRGKKTYYNMFLEKN